MEHNTDCNEAINEQIMTPVRTDRPVAAEYDMARGETRDGANEVISG